MQTDKSDCETKTEPWLRGIPQTIWALGFVSLFMDISSEMIHSLLPLFLVTVLGSSTRSVGLIEGVGEATALIMKSFSGAISDWLGKRKVLVIAGYTLGAMVKPMFALAQGVGLVFTARVVDRIGKGIRSAPRDALMADVTMERFRGAAYGLRQSLDTVGACFGPFLAMVLMIAADGLFRIVFWIALAPALISVLILIFAVKEQPSRFSGSSGRVIHFQDIMKLTPAFWLVVVFGSLFSLARFSEAFMLLRAETIGMETSKIPVVMIIMNISYSLSAYPIGRLSDRIGRKALMAVGLFVLIVSDFVFAIATTSWYVATGALLWGLHMGLSQGLLSAMVADTAPESLRGTAFGIFSMITGGGILIASLVAGLLWDFFGPPATFLAGALFSAAALMVYLILHSRLGRG